jgi:hypothetical protein
MREQLGHEYLRQQNQLLMQQRLKMLGDQEDLHEYGPLP